MALLAWKMFEMIHSQKVTVTAFGMARSSREDESPSLCLKYRTRRMCYFHSESKYRSKEKRNMAKEGWQATRSVHLTWESRNSGPAGHKKSVGVARVAR